MLLNITYLGSYFKAWSGGSSAPSARTCHDPLDVPTRMYCSRLRPGAGDLMLREAPAWRRPRGPKHIIPGRHY